ncbi:MAG: TldD/PmbA family protein [Candidatus Bathyarchaeia archaeon]
MTTEELLGVSERTVKLAVREGVDQAQASAFILDMALTRFANSQIHQNISSKMEGVTIKVVTEGNKVGFIRINTLDRRRIGRALRRAIEIANVSPPNKEFKSLPSPESWTPIEGAFDEDTAVCSPEQRADIVKDVITTAHSKSKIVKAVAGSMQSGSLAYAISNSLNVSAWASLSLAQLRVTVISELDGSEGFGYSEQHSRLISDIDPISVADKAADRSVKSVKPERLMHGEYEVVLSPMAVGTLAFYLGYIGFNATRWQDGESFVKYHLNERVFDEKISMKDDARDPRTLYSIPIDGEGVPKRVVQLVDRGVVSEGSICYDSFTAGKEGKRSTGHSMPPAIEEYLRRTPLPINLIIKPGDATMDEMVSDTKRGVFITRFHYTNPVDRAKAVLTGLTRDGTFLIERGEISKPIMNLRFTDSLLSALSDVPMVGQGLERLEYVTAPAMKCKKLRFTGVTEY